MALMSKPTHDPKLTRWWWRTLREWVYELIDPLWAAFRGDNSDEIALANVTGINDVSASELAALDGLTATTSELNILSGLTADASELNKADRTAGDGIAEASKNVVLDANKDILGKRYDISQSLLNAIVGGEPFLSFDGINSYVSKSNDANLNFGANTDFSLEAWFRTFKDYSADEGTLINKGAGTGGATTYYRLRIRTDNRLEIRLRNGSSEKISVYGTTVNDGEWHHAIVTADRDGDLTVYLDTDAGTPTDIDGHGDIDDVSEPLQIGIRDGVERFDGDIAAVRIWNRALTVNEVKALSSGAPLEYADIGADQADKVTNGEDWTGATGTTPPNSWSDSGAGTATYIVRDNTPVNNFGDDKALEINASGGSKTLYQSVAQAGKRYRVSFVYRNLDGSSSSYVALGSSDNKVTLQNTGISGDGIVFEQELLADGTDLKFFVDTGGTLQIDHVKVIQIGCVAAYLPEGITHAQWQDASGNELHGSVSGASPMNLPSAHVARYIKQGITGDTTLSAAVPAGYRIKSIVAEVSGAGAGMRLNIGTSAGGTDVVNNQDISSNGLFDLTVAKNIFSFSTAQSLYVNDDGGTAWSGVSVDLYIDLERVK